MATNFVGKIDLIPSPCSLHDIRYGGATSIRHKGNCYSIPFHRFMQAQANKLPDSMDAGKPIN